MEITTSTGFCLAALSSLLMQYTGWQPVNDSQKTTLAAIEQVDTRTQGAIDLYTASMVTKSYKELSEWLIKRNWEEILKSVPPGAAGYMASVFDAKVKWADAGRERPVFIDDVKYDGASLSNVKLYYNDSATIPTKTPGIYMTLVACEEKIGSGVELHQRAEKALKALPTVRSTWGSVTFPKVQKTINVDVSFLEGLHCSNFRIDEAIKMIRFKMDHLGAEAEAAMVATAKGIPPSITFEGPFIAILHAEDATTPLFCFYSGPDSWSELAE